MKFSFILACAIAAVASTATAQETEAVDVTPCTIVKLSRPTLKRRQTNPDDQPKIEHQNEVIVAAPPCVSGSAKLEDAAPAMNPQGGQSPMNKPVAIKFEGLTVIEESEVRKILREHGVNKSLDSAITGESIADAEGLIKRLLSDHGHRHAEVSSRVEKSANELSLVTFVINEGPFFTISEIRFVGNRVFSEQLLSANLNDCLARINEDRPKVYQAERFDYCTHLLLNFVKSEGYLQAKFSEPKIEESGAGLVITVQSDEGVLYRLGRIEIEGFDHVAEEDIRALIDLRTGDIANGEKLSKALYEKLKGVYGEKGFIQYTAEIEPEFFISASRGGIVNFRITIDEGRRFKIRKIGFKGDSLPQNDLRQLLLLREGDVYNQRLFEESIKKINEIEWFYLIDKDGDVDYRTNEEEGLLDVVIKLTRRAP